MRQKFKMNKFIQGVCGLTLATLSASSFAGWNTSQESIAGMNSWVYTPSDTGQPRSLMLVLHGCAQTNSDLKTNGNLANGAENHNTVIVAPYRLSAWTGNASANCWAYSGGDENQTSQHSDALISMVNQLVADSSYNIDPNRVYVTGLSSGAAMSLVVGCKAPDLFAGVDSIAGPSVGSSQNSALSTPMLSSTISTGISKCNSLAGAKSSHLANQITHITWGDQDKDGDHPGQAYSSYGTNPAGHTSLVSAVYSKANYQIMQDVYGTGAFASQGTINAYGGNGADQYFSKDSDGNVRVAYLAIDNVGHAWPAADPTKSNGAGGTWMAQDDMDYTSYILDWFEEHNLHEPANPAPVVTINSTDSTDNSASVNCTATDDGSVAQVDTQLIQNEQVITEHFDVTNCADTYSGLAEGYYQIKVIATDDEGKPGEVTSESIKVGNPIDAPPIVTANGSATGQNLTSSGTATDDIEVTLVEAQLLQGTNVITENQNVAVATDGSYSVTFSDVAVGTYTIKVTAVDSANQSSSETTADLTAVNQGVTAPLPEHINAGRLDYGGGYSTCYLEYGSTAAFRLDKVDLGGGQCRWEDNDASCVGPTLIGAECGSVIINTGCEEFTDSNYNHKVAGRAHSSGSYWTPDYFANGSNDAMAGSTYGSNTLHSTDDGTSWSLGGCP